ncbi:MAG: DUF6440 family protein [Clostridia bacterium]|nr:DUF6440 family protein [Clostridia bacterium]
MKDPDGSRFVRIYKEGSELRTAGLRVILVDRQTGVNYLYVANGYGGGLTPLLDASGKPVVTPIS